MNAYGQCFFLCTLLFAGQVDDMCAAAGAPSSCDCLATATDEALDVSFPLRKQFLERLATSELVGMAFALASENGSAAFAILPSQSLLALPSGRETRHRLSSLQC
jgi:hypothetical protein